MNIGSCGLHIIHVSFKTGAELTLRQWKRFTEKGLFTVLHDASVRCEDLYQCNRINYTPIKDKDIQKKDNLLSKKNVSIDFAAKTTITKMQQKDQTTRLMMKSV